MSHKGNDYFNDLENEHKGYGESSCCGAGTYGDYLICEDCKEHCEDITINDK